MEVGRLWVHDVNELWRDYQIWPCKTMSRSEQYNATTRFLILYCVVMSYFYKSWRPLQMLFIVILGIVILHRNEKRRNVKSVVSTMKVTEPECMKPSESNPYMNRLLGDENKEPCCKVTNETMDTLMTKNLPKDDWDVLSKGNSQRQFYTVPCQSGSCDSVKFANFLYNNPYETNS